MGLDHSGRNFDLQILRAGEVYVANVLESPAGDAQGTFVLPFDEAALDNLIAAVRRGRNAARGAQSPDIDAARRFGSQLFDAVFAGSVRDVFQRSLGIADYADQDLRIRLRLTNVPELLGLPWELLFDSVAGRFLAVDRHFALVRFAQVPEPLEPAQVTWPLRVLVVDATPTNAHNPELVTAQAWLNARRALRPLRGSGQVEMHYHEGIDHRSLLQALQRGPWHVLHFIGYGGVETEEQESYPILRDGNGGGRGVSADRLAQMLRGCTSLRLVVLDACEGAGASRGDPVAGVAQSLVRAAMPAVVAMQFPLTDEAAIRFGESFYRGLVGSRPVDLALADARREVRLAGEGAGIEWAAPVLYMHGDGVLFAFEPAKPLVSSGLDKSVASPRREPEARPAPPPAARIWNPGEIFRDASCAPEMVVIPPGEFTMGSPAAEVGREDTEGPEHRVRIGKAFALGKYAVTVGGFKRFADATGYQTEAEGGKGDEVRGIYKHTFGNEIDRSPESTWRAPGFPQNDRHPVVGVSWNDAQEYLKWLSGLTGKAYRLPSEAEWEYACRAGTAHSRYWGDLPDQAYLYANLADRSYRSRYGWPFRMLHMFERDDGFAYTAPVGSYRPNRYGLYDMLGNVWEWCEDQFWGNSYQGAPADGSAWLYHGDRDFRRVISGGAWYCSPEFVRSAFRWGFSVSSRYDSLGFRPARTLD